MFRELILKDILPRIICGGNYEAGDWRVAKWRPAYGTRRKTGMEQETGETGEHATGVCNC
jgi:hypothetical protein